MLLKKFEEQVQKHPDHLAVTTQNSSVTYRELDQRANQIAHQLQKSRSDSQNDGNVTYGQNFDMTVGLLFEHGVEMIIGLLGVLKAGYIYVPLDPNYPENRLRYMVENSGTSLLLTNNKNQYLAESLSSGSDRAVTIINLDALPMGIPLTRLERQELRTEIAYILYTSGSTGVPKGVMQTHENIWHFVKNYINDFSLSWEDRITLFSALSHDAAVMDIFSGLLSGGTLYPLNLKNQENLSDLADWLRYERITIYHSVPTVYRYFTKTLTGHEIFPDLRFIILGGEAVLKHDVITYQNFFESHTTLVNLYGQSESSYNSAQLFQIGHPFEKITLGREVEDCEIWVVNEDHEETADFEVGEIVVVCKHVAKGYWKDPEKTAKAFSDSPEIGRIYWTGDLGRRLLDGTIEFVGRKDFQVKIRGYRVDLSEIESSLLEHPEISEAVVLARQDPEGNSYLCAYVVKQADITEIQLRNYLTNLLPDYMIPPFYVYLEHLPLTPTNKVDRNALPEPSRKNNFDHYIPPRNDIEKRVVLAWAEVLHYQPEEISIDSHFFDLGGNSLSLMNLATLLSREFKKNVRISDLFQQRTVTEMANFLNNFSSIGGDEGEISLLTEREWYSVSSAQKRMFILHQLEGQTTAYNMPMAFLVQGLLDQYRLCTALASLIDRHEVLRTSFHLVDGELVQKIHTDVELPFEMYTLDSNVPPEQIEEQFQQFIRPFDLTQAPLLRVGLIELGSEQILIFDIYHIISDGTSNDLLISEFLRLYAREELPPLTIQYKDYAAWQNKILTEESTKTAEKYWLNQFDPAITGKEIPVLNLLTDYPRPATQDYRGKRFTFNLNPFLTERLTRLSRNTETTLFMILLSAFNILLARYSGQEDIIIGSPVAGRGRPELNQIVGMFVNTLALRNAPRGTQPYLHFLQQVKDTTLQALLHQDYPFELLVNQLKLTRDPGRNPLFDVNFRLQNIQKNEIIMSDLKVKPIQYDILSSQFDLQLTCYESSGGIVSSFEYATCLFKEETIAQLAKHYQHLLEDIVNKPEVSIKELRILSLDEREKLINGVNQTSLPYPEELLVHQLFAQQVAKTPEMVALVARSIQNHKQELQNIDYSMESIFCEDQPVVGSESKDDLSSVVRRITPDSYSNQFRTMSSEGSDKICHQRLTYCQLNEQANQLARHLRQRGVRRESVVGIMVQRSIELVVGILAVMKAGGVYLPLDPEYPIERIQYMLSDSGARMLLTQESLGSKIEFDGEMIDLGDESLYTGVSENLANINQATDLIYLIYTSGSTGQPKGTMVEHRNLHNFILGMQQVLDLKPGKAICSLTTVSFDIFVLESLLPLTVGMRVLLATEEEQIDPKLCHNFMLDEKAEMIQLTPSRLQVFLEDRAVRQSFKNLKEILVGGEAFPERLLSELQRLTSAKIYNMYGPTETTVWSGVSELTTASRVDIGYPIANTQIYILDQYLNPLPCGVIGELYISGDGVVRGYYERPELSVERFIPNPFRPGVKMYRTGDLAFRQRDGRIVYVGRSDQQVKIRGYRIEVGEIEACLNKYPGIKESVVISKTGADGFKALVSYYVSPNVISVTDLRQHLLQTLPEYMVPGFYQQLTALPLTPNGKVDRKALPELGSYRPNLDTEYQAAETEIQQMLVRLWSEVLKLEKIGIYDNFFDLGGNSLLLIQLHQKLEAALPGRVNTVDLFAYPTIARLTEFIEKQEKALNEEHISQDFWQKELGDEIQLITLPVDYYHDSSTPLMSNQLRVHLNEMIIAQLHQMAMENTIDLIDITTGMYIFLLKELSGNSEVTIEVEGKDGQGRSFPLKINFSDLTDLLALFGQIHEKYAIGQKMSSDKIYGYLRKILSPTSIIPYIGIQQPTMRRDNDLMIILHKIQGRWVLDCHYNEMKLRGDKVEEFLQQYLSLFEMVTQEYYSSEQKEATKC